ncbi:hypothetical protein BCR37DRAFT_385755 [Protomyces lactucae-debilis]|uniref:Uncharacterized protein n=1 Tax=Protomyces lactucae-debilis TaxID=2754530 RepID=A0A1Y2FUC9_PROLT|nr:uncharacterized protein BCR37DRAFT_385755 [Protomyces lactucae-debilis]ORY86295.1 hypothetical protein BCR37DRAFT_385755 [Protomyces lactucae-debilis]
MESWPKYLELSPAGELVDISDQRTPRNTEHARHSVQQDVPSSARPPPLEAISASRRELRESTLLWFKHAFDEPSKEMNTMRPASRSDLERAAGQLHASQQFDMPSLPKKMVSDSNKRCASASSSHYSTTIPETPKFTQKKRRRARWWLIVLPSAAVFGFISILSLFLGIPNILNRFLRFDLHELSISNQTASSFSANLKVDVFASTRPFSTIVSATTMTIKYDKDLFNLAAPDMAVRRTGVEVSGIDVVQVLSADSLKALLQRLLFDQKSARVEMRAKTKLKFNAHFAVPIRLKKSLDIAAIDTQFHANITYKPTVLRLAFHNPTHVSIQMDEMSVVIKSQNSSLGTLRSPSVIIRPGRNEISLFGNSTGVADHAIVTVFPGVASAAFVGRRINFN